MNDFDKALAALKKASQRGIVPGLSRIAGLLHRLGDPQEKTHVIHVSGTNGKGSFGAMLGSVLTFAGYRTGNFSSPALTGVTDGFRINCAEISDELFADAVLRTADICRKMDDKPTEFEMLTAAAYDIFARENCDIAIIECGLGGDEDSTNVIAHPVLSVITNVRFDHCGILGNTLAEIAAHKSGIIKPGRPVYYGGEEGEALDVISECAGRLESTLYLPSGDGVSVRGSSLDGTDIVYKGREYRLALLGSCQTQNVRNVLECVEILRNMGISIPEEAVRRGLAEVRWHGRFELLSRDPVVISDGAHNPDGITRAAESIRLYFGEDKVALLIGVMADKDYRCYPEILDGLISKAFTVKPANKRSLDSSALAEVFASHGVEAEAFDELPEGVCAAYEYARETGVPLIALGSLYMYQEFTEALGAVLKE